MAIPSMNDLEEILFDEGAIKDRVRNLAEKIVEDYKEKELIWVTVMKGADVFSNDLRKEACRYSIKKYGDLIVDIVPDIVLISLFNNPDAPKEEGAILGPDPNINYKGKPVLVVEDIVDRGLTMKYLLEHLKRQEPASLSVCSLLSKPSKRQVDIPLSYLGFEVPDKFVVGYGLDYEQRYRHLPVIGVLKPEIYSPKR